MGLDGGTKITRSDVLRGQSWRLAQADTSRSSRGGSVNGVYQQQQLDEQNRRAVLWASCPLSGLPLQPPLVCDALGQLINRQAVLEHLLAAKSVFEDEAARIRHSNTTRAAAGAFDHIRSLRDVFNVTLTENPDHNQQQQQQVPAAAGEAGAAGSSSVQESRWVCPVTLLPCASKQPFSALRVCGHVLSAKALTAITQMASDSSSSCPVCGAAFDSSSEVVLVNGSRQHMDEVRAALQQKAAAKAAAKSKAAEGGKKRRRQAEVQLLEQRCAVSKQTCLLKSGGAQGAVPAGQQAEQQEARRRQSGGDNEQPQHKLFKGLSNKSDDMLAGLQIKTVQDLGQWKHFRAARAIAILAATEEPGKRPDGAASNINGILDKEWESKSLADILAAPPSALQGLGPGSDGVLAGLGIKSVADLAAWRFAIMADALTILAEHERADFSSQ